jgi:hypothetical protein
MVPPLSQQAECAASQFWWQLPLMFIALLLFVFVVIFFGGFCARLGYAAGVWLEKKVSAVEKGVGL